MSAFGAVLRDLFVQRLLLLAQVPRYVGVDVLEHAVQRGLGILALGVVERVLHPEENPRFVIRLDNGFSLKAVADDGEGFEPGERVRIAPGSRGARIWRE